MIFLLVGYFVYTGFQRHGIKRPSQKNGSDFLPLAVELNELDAIGGLHSRLGNEFNAGIDGELIHLSFLNSDIAEIGIGAAMLVFSINKPISSRGNQLGIKTHSKPCHRFSGFPILKFPEANPLWKPFCRYGIQGRGEWRLGNFIRFYGDFC